MASLCVAVLVDRGLLDYEMTVASYWPEFAQNGKENITVRMLLNHQASDTNNKSNTDSVLLKGKINTASPKR